MKFDPKKHHRRSIRLQKYDYAQPGGYYITVVTFQRDLLFGEIVDEEMNLNDHGRVVAEGWCAIPKHFLNVELGVYIVMPNHVHGIIVINDKNGKATNSSPFVGARACLAVYNQNPLAPLLVHSNPRSPAASDMNSTSRISGNAIITNT